MAVSKLKQMLTDEDAVSPVIGVILMVAVTVVLAAVIAGFVFGLGDDLSASAPNTQVAFDYNSETDNLDVVHDGGDTITVDNTGELALTGDLASDGSDDPSEGTPLVIDSSSSAPYASGDVIFTGATVEGGEEVELQWASNEGGTSTTLGTFQAP